MQNIIIDQPYQFVPARHHWLWSRVIQLYLPRYLRREHGVTACRFDGMEKLVQSLDAGHGIVLTPNHCRPCDPMVMATLVGSVGQRVFTMASWHLFMQNRLMRWVLPKAGAFSMYREGLDREAIKFAANVLVEARHPLVLFPEGVISRTNDRLNHLMDGTVLIARTAARQRFAGKSPGKVVIHPVAIRYFYGGDVTRDLVPALEAIEQRLTWRSQTSLTIEERIIKIGHALLSLKEMAFFNESKSGPLYPRLQALINRILAPLEDEWLKGRRPETVVGRVKVLRTAILPELVTGKITEEERSRRWLQLADLYLAQQLNFYPSDYFDDPPTPEQLLETLERFEEDLTDQVRIYRPIHAFARVGEAIEVGPERDRSKDGDKVMLEIQRQLQQMLAESRERRHEFR